ncbi:MAG TPA: glycogen-binding domain-containing protein [Gemmatimonadales bacterium]|nr:glycogen-binding domain-containing protein [Gemmatimonadales bacterium]
MQRLLLLVVCAAGFGLGPATAQTRASLGLGIGTVRYGGGTSFSSAAVSPAFQYASGTLLTDVSGSFASLPDAAWSSQGRGDLWVASPAMADRWRIGVEGIAAGTRRTDGGWTAAAHGIGEVLWSQPRWGVGLGAGPSTGWIAHTPSITALHVRARAWWRPDAPGASEWQASIEPTRFPDGWFTDVSAGVTLERGPLVASFGAAGRLSDISESTGAGSGFVQFFLSPGVSLELAGGSYLTDPYQGLPRAGFLAFGLRLHGTPRALPARDPSLPRRAALVPASRGDSLVVRFRFDRVRSVAIAGDWNEWHAIPLRPLDGDLWEGTLALRRGIYHFNLLVDGNDWVVPRGVATVSDGLGGMVGVLLVP